MSITSYERGDNPGCTIVTVENYSMTPSRLLLVKQEIHDTYADEVGKHCRMAAKDGATTCHHYCAAYLIPSGKLMMLAMRYVRSDKKEADTVKRVFDCIEDCPFDIDLLLADRGFYNEHILRWSREIAAIVVPVQKKGERMRKKLDTLFVHDDLSIYKDCKRELKFPLAVAVSYKPEIVAQAERSFKAMWYAIWLIPRRSRSNGSIGNAHTGRELSQHMAWISIY
jgi:hypothetical protein